MREREAVIAVRDVPGGAAFEVKVSPKASRAGIGPEHDGALKVSVTAAPQNGKANRALIEELAAALALAPGRLEIRRGARGRRKEILARGLSAETLRARLDGIAEGGRRR